ncbi:FkbM family methyltransferase [Sphingomonas sinipercae]|uniref:FkbM family methyltransferase n=1 Tax=Sphingomonas sinipercae TaxID=2714944 RepID=A0A6G7ZKE6_9SPHN|nr:FkbM family methyltransferase [Sphingomonas sinipercae]QIL01451.1 FkbM family methyltransferase [Sphingomonas sinipercae]
MRFYGQFDPPVDRYLFETFFRGRSEPGFFVECGAFDGVFESSCLFFEESLDWAGVNIEASPLIFPLLVERRPNAINLNLALSDAWGTTIFRHVSDDLHGSFLGWGSIEHQARQEEEIENSAMIVTEHLVETRPWRDIAAIQSRDRVDLLVLDVEGHELAAIDGMSGATVLPDVICVEHGQVGLQLLRDRLDAFGYDYVSSLHVNSFFVARRAGPQPGI